MTTTIRAWQIIDQSLIPIQSSLIEAGRTEVNDLQSWIRSKPEILGADLTIIGEQVPTKAGFIDFLGVDGSGNLVVVELKRDILPREVLAQALDYATEIASCDVENNNRSH